IGAARGFKTQRNATDLASSRAAGSPADSPGKMPILVAVETLGVSGASGGRSRLSIGGWALAASRILEIAVALDGKVVGKANYGQARPDIAQFYPGLEGADRSGFMLSVELLRLTGEAIEPELTVRTADGEIGRRALRVDVPPQQVEVPAKPPMRLYIDDAGVDERGILRVEGWVVCLVQIESVEAFIEDERIGEAEFGRVREDVEQARSDYPNARFSGFVLLSDVSRLGAGPKTVAIRAVARPGIAREGTP